MPTLCKAERLCRQDTISALFVKGKRIKVSAKLFMLKVYLLPLDEAKPAESYSLGSEENVQILFSAPKSSFKKAVHRNRIKRLLRESYRNHKEDFCRAAQESGKKWTLVLMFVGFKKNAIQEDFENGIVEQLLSKAKPMLIDAINRKSGLEKQG